MKNFTLLIALITLLSFNACKNKSAADKVKANESKSSQNKTDEEPNGEYPEISFEEALFDFGSVKEGVVVEHTFSFTNTGTQPLKVSQAKPSCGCTAPDWTREEIAPGEKGMVTVKFDSKGRPGQQNKSVRLITNTKNGNEIVSFTAYVEEE